MMKHYECQPSVWHKKPLIFDWDENTGEVTGPDAQIIVDRSKYGQVGAHPMPQVWDLSDSPLTSKTDMAAIIGEYWRVPDDLAPFYPVLDAGPDLEDLPPGAIVG